MAALNRFLSRLGEWGLPFFKLLKRQDKFKWTTEAVEALENLKHHLQSPPILTAPLPGEELLLYIVATLVFPPLTSSHHDYNIMLSDLSR